MLTLYYSGRFCLPDKRTSEDTVLSELHSRPYEIASVHEHVCLWHRCLQRLSKCPHIDFPLPSFAIILHLAPRHTLRHAVAKAHRPTLMHVNTHIISALSPLQKLYLLQSCQAMKWLVLGQNGAAARVGTRHSCRYTRATLWGERSALLWPQQIQVESIPLWNFNTWYGVIWGAELKKPWTDALTGLRTRVSKYTNNLHLRGSRAPWMEFGYFEGI